MRFSVARFAFLSLPFISGLVRGQDAPQLEKKKFDYQSDVARLRKIVINSLYSHRDVFLRELISNANDANEKYRITSLTDKSILDEHPLNITIKAIPNEGGKGGKVIVTDTGIGMSPEELANNLGTLAKSGTSDFLSKAENGAGGDAGNFIGQFGLGFYSSFLVSDQVYVASVPPPSPADPHPKQYVFSSNADENDFEIYEDPRGNTLGRGTEITMVLKDDALEYLKTDKIKDLVAKHSAFSSSFPIYLQITKSEEVPDDIPYAGDELENETPAADAAETPVATEDDDEAVIEDVDESVKVEKKAAAEKPHPMKTVTWNEWVQLNDQPPLWTRDPKNVTQAEYDQFFMSSFKDEHNPPLAVHHFKGDSGSGVSFKAILFVPPTLDISFWRNPDPITDGVKVMVKRTFITSDLAENPLPKWASWIKAIIDADDLPLNVSRETLQNNRFLNQVKSMLIKRLIGLLQSTAEKDPKKYTTIMDTYGAAIKLGAVEATSEKDRAKLASLTRYSTNFRNSTGFDDYLKNRKKGQNQIFYLAGIGSTPQDLAKSIFVEKLHARGYEVFFLTEPMDEILMGNLKVWKGMTFQDVSKTGLKYGDEEEIEADKKEEESETVRFQPLLDFLKEESKDIVLGVTVSNRLVTSPCAIVVDRWGYSANMEKLMAAQTGREGGFMNDWVKKQKYLEINPRSPLIQGLLSKVEELNKVEEGEEKDAELEQELKEVASILIDGALVRSGFEVPDSNEFFTRMDRVLRRSLGVSEAAKADDSVLPAPPVEDSPLAEDVDLRVEIDIDEKLPTAEEEQLAEAEEAAKPKAPEDVPISILPGTDGETPLIKLDPAQFIAQHDEL